MEEYMTRKAAASLLCVTERSIDRYIEQGRLKKYISGTKRIRLRLQEVQQLKAVVASDVEVQAFKEQLDAAVAVEAK